MWTSSRRRSRRPCRRFWRPISLLLERVPPPGCSAAGSTAGLPGRFGTGGTADEREPRGNRVSDLLGNDDREPVRTLWELVERRAQLTPDRPLLLSEHGDLTCAEFKDRCERVAAGLHDMGIRPGSPVSWQLPTRVDTVVLSIALARLGAVQNPIIHIYRQKEVAFALRKTEAELVCVPGTWRGF